jgi:molecular chaperone GrpE
LKTLMTEKKKHAHKEHIAEEPAAGTAEPCAELGALQNELEQARIQAAEYLDGWKRTQADLVNYRKRVERDSSEAKVSAACQAAARWFSVMDDFERALKERSGAQNLAQWADGVELIYRKGVAALEAEGISPIEPDPGTDFDPNLHEAVTREISTDRGDGEILEMLHRGYRMGDRVLRPAQVRVACKPEDSA